MRYDGILFDLDGTVSNSEPGLLASMRVMHEAMAWPLPPDAELRQWLGPPVGTVLRDLGHDEQTVERALEAFRGHLVAEGLANATPYPGIPELLILLRERNIPTAIATFKLHADAQLAVSLNGLDGLFTSVHGRIGDEAGHSKAPLMRRALASLSLPDDATVVMIGDRRHDIGSAKELGLPSIGVRYGFAPEGELEVAAPGDIVDTVEELTALLDARTRTLPSS